LGDAFDLHFDVRRQADGKAENAGARQITIQTGNRKPRALYKVDAGSNAK